MSVSEKGHQGWIGLRMYHPASANPLSIDGDEQVLRQSPSWREVIRKSCAGSGRIQFPLKLWVHSLTF